MKLTKLFLVLSVFMLVFLAACNASLVDDHDHDGDGVPDHAAEDHDDELHGDDHEDEDHDGDEHHEDEEK